MVIKTEQLVYSQTTYKNPLLHPFSMHCHSTYELIFFEGGEASYIIDEKKYKLHKNDLVFARPFKYHCIEFSGDCDYSRINITFEGSIVGEELLASVPAELDVINCPPDSILHGIFSRMRYYSSRLDESDFTRLLSSVLTETVYNLRLVDIDMAHIPKSLPPLLAEALEYINENLFTVKDVGSISRLVNVSEQYLFRLFQAQLHISPHRYIMTKRMMHAQALLKQGKRPTDIYTALGFDSYVSFYKQYKSTFGHSPSEDSGKL